MCLAWRQGVVGGRLRVPAPARVRAAAQAVWGAASRLAAESAGCGRRWERAHKLGLHPPPEVKALLEQQAPGSAHLENLWSGRV